MKSAKIGTWILGLCLCACGPNVEENGDGGADGDGGGDAQSDADDPGDGFEVEWAMGFYHREEGMIGGQIGYIEIAEDGTGAWHRIQCDFSPVEPWEFRWRALSDTEIELYPVDGQDDLPTLGGSVKETEVLQRKSPEGADALVESGVTGGEPLTYLTGRPCNVPVPREGCPNPGFSRLDEIPICDAR